MVISGGAQIIQIADLHIKIRIIDNESLHLHIPRQVRVDRQAADAATARDVRQESDLQNGWRGRLRLCRDSEPHRGGQD